MTSTYQNSYHAAHLTQNAARAVLWQVLTDYLNSYIPSNAHVQAWLDACYAQRMTIGSYSAYGRSVTRFS